MPKRYFKVLNVDGTPCRGGTGQWALPTADGPGAWMPAIENIELCTRGYHACRAQDLMKWLGPAIFECELRGDIIVGDDKVVAAEARLARKLNWDERIARHFACDCAERVLPIYEREYPDDTRPREAIAIARRFADGDGTDDQLDAAAAAAWAAAGVTAVRAAGVAAAAWAAAGAAAAAWAADAAVTVALAERRWQTERLLQYLEAPIGALLQGAADADTR